MNDPQKGIERDVETDEEPFAEVEKTAENTPPADLNATITLSPEALAALLEEVKKGKKD
jgi:hypothetical protein